MRAAISILTLLLITLTFTGAGYRVCSMAEPGPSPEAFSLLDVVREFEWHVNRIRQYCKDNDTWAFERFDITHGRLSPERTSLNTIEAANLFFMAYRITGNLTYLSWAKSTLAFIRQNLVHPETGLLYEYWDIETNSAYKDVMHVYLMTDYLRVLCYAYWATVNSTFLSWALRALDSFHTYCLNHTTWLMYRLVNLTTKKPQPDRAPYYHCQYGYAYGWLLSALSWLYEFTGNRTVLDVAIKVGLAYWATRNETTNLPPHLVDYRGQVPVSPWMRPGAGGLGHISMVLAGYAHLYRVSRDPDIYDIIKALSGAIAHYYWRSDIGRFRYSCDTDGTPISDHLESHGYEGMGDFLFAALYAGDEKALGRIVASLALAHDIWLSHGRFDEWRTYPDSNEVAEWTFYRLSFSLSAFWYAFWGLKNATYFDYLLEMYKWHAEHRRSSYGYYYGSIATDERSMSPKDFYFFWRYLLWSYDLARRLIGPLDTEMGDIVLASTSPIELLMTYTSSLRVFVNSKIGGLELLLLYSPAKPSRVKACCTWHPEPKPTREAFDNSNSTCWYYDEDTRMLFVKVRSLNPPEEILIEWSSLTSKSAKKSGGAIATAEGDRSGEEGWISASLPILLVSLLIAWLLKKY